MAESDTVNGAVTTTGAAVAVVALARFLATEHSRLPLFLQAALDNAEKSGLAAQDLALLRMIVSSVSG